MPAVEESLCAMELSYVESFVLEVLGVGKCAVSKPLPLSQMCVVHGRLAHFRNSICSSDIIFYTEFFSDYEIIHSVIFLR
jgi:hypothetical protein